MAKKETQKTEPQISNIPLPISDVPLVIDLPDGQKLVIGKMTEGAVIEVATWRGTGRPDSRTNRLMLGMSSTNSVSEEKPSTESSASEKKIAGIKVPKIGFNLKLPKFGDINLPKIKDFTFAAKGAASKVIEKSRDLTPTETVGDLDINAWLAKISNEAEKKVAKSNSVKSNKSTGASKSSSRSPISPELPGRTQSAKKSAPKKALPKPKAR